MLSDNTRYLKEMIRGLDQAPLGSDIRVIRDQYYQNDEDTYNVVGKEERVTEDIYLKKLLLD